MKNILPDWLYNIIYQNYSLDLIQEIRIRNNHSIQICYNGKMVELKTDSGLYLKSILANDELIKYIISVATNQSLYAYEDQIKNGYISTKNGIRIGLCGTVVYDNNKIIMIKDISSLNIRISHNIVNCSNDVIGYIISNMSLKNTLIISPPGCGKTTIIRDIIQKISNKFNIPNIMVIDEKFEIAGENKKYDLGKNVDIIQGSNKNFAFYNSIKVMNPSVIVTDEIVYEDDIDGIKFAIKSGVKIIATVHANSLLDLKSKKYFDYLIKEKYFERFIILSKRNGPGTIEEVFDEKEMILYSKCLI